MSKSVREEELKFYLCFLDGILDQNSVLHSVDVEDNVYPEILQVGCEKLSGTFRLKSFLRSGNFIEKTYLKIN